MKPWISTAAIIFLDYVSALLMMLPDQKYQIIIMIIIFTQSVIEGH